MARNRIIGVRVDEEQSEQFERAASAAGKVVSDWLRDLGASAVAIPVGSTSKANSNVALMENSKNTPSSLGFGADISAFLAKNSPKVIVAVEQKCQVVTPWLPELQRIASMAEFDPIGATKEFERLAVGFEQPKRWDKMDIKAKAKWLDENCPLE